MCSAWGFGLRFVKTLRSDCGSGGEEGDFAKEVLHGGSLADDRGGNSAKVKLIARRGGWVDGKRKAEDAERLPT